MSINIEFIQFFETENLGLDTLFTLISLFLAEVLLEIGFQAMAALMCILQKMPKVGQGPTKLKFHRDP